MSRIESESSFKLPRTPYDTNNNSLLVGRAYESRRESFVNRQLNNPLTQSHRNSVNIKKTKF